MDLNSKVFILKGFYLRYCIQVGYRERSSCGVSKRHVAFFGDEIVKSSSLLKGVSGVVSWVKRRSRLTIVKGWWLWVRDRCF